MVHLIKINWNVFEARYINSGPSLLNTESILRWDVRYEPDGNIEQKWFNSAVQLMIELTS